MMKYLFVIVTILLMHIQYVRAFDNSSCPMKRKVRIGWKEWEPFKRLENGVPTGVDIGPVMQTLEKMGCSYELVDLPWKRTIVALKNGEVDLSSGAVFSTDRTEYLIFSIPYRSDIIGLVSLSSANANLSKLTIEQILKSGKIISSTIGNNAGEKFEKLKKQFPENFREVVEVENSFKMLIAKRIDYILGSLALLKWRAKHMGIAIEEHADLRVVQDIYVVFSKKSVNQDFVDQYNRVMKATLSK